MFVWLLAALATAGNIYVDSKTPILVKLEGELVRKDPATRIVIPDLAQSTYKIEVTNLLGNTIAWKEVDVSWDDDVNLEFSDGRLDLVQEATELVYGGKNQLPIMPFDKFDKLERKLVKGGLKKKLKNLVAMTEGWGLTMKQTDEVLGAFDKREDRIAALYEIIDHCTEPEKYNALMHLFPVKSDRERASELFEAVLSAQGG